MDAQRFEHPSKNRYYLVWTQEDLFGLVVVRVWGGTGTGRGRMHTQPCVNAQQCELMLTEVVRRRLQRGYVRC